ncbi:MAG TPA: hypothetical protein PLH55_02225, partial [Spirochaetales bacterium]|nr:hypothetical protein [Spirochaetales bacterium]
QAQEYKESLPRKDVRMKLIALRRKDAKIIQTKRIREIEARKEITSNRLLFPVSEPLILFARLPLRLRVSARDMFVYKEMAA